jgi:hypothetical protein
MSKFDVAQNQAPKIFIHGVSGFLADVDSTGHLLIGGVVGNPGNAFTMGPKTEITGPSGYVADVDSNANLLTHNEVPTVVQSVSVSSTLNTQSVITLTLPANARAGNTIVTLVNTYNSPAVTILSAVDNLAVNVYSIVSGPDASSFGLCHTFLLKCENIVGTPKTLTITLSGNQYFMGLAVETTGGALGYPTQDVKNFTAISNVPNWIGTSLVTNDNAELLLTFGATSSGATVFTAAGANTMVNTLKDVTDGLACFCESQSVATFGDRKSVV